MGLSPKAPPTPDYTALAEKTAQAQRDAAGGQTLANRPSQTDIYGNTSTWTQNPDGSWAQKQSMSGANQGIYDATQKIRGELTGQVGNAMNNPYSTEGLPTPQGYDMSALQGVDVNNLGGGQFNMDPMGNSKAIQDATMGLLQPQRDRARDVEIQRMKSMGLSEDSAAFQRGLQTLGQGDTDAQLKALLAGQAEYGNQYNRALQGNQSNFGQNADSQRLAMALRGQQFGEQGQQSALDMELRKSGLNEQQFMRQQPLNDLQKLIQTQQGFAPAFGSVGSAAGMTGANYTDAAKSTYQEQLANMNADAAYRQQILGAAGQIGAGFFGSQTGQNMTSDAWNAAKNWWNTPSSSPYVENTTAFSYPSGAY